MGRSAPLLSFCMLNRNGAETIHDCLASVAHLADELIVVDTGSTDDSPGIARRFGAKVLDRPWTDDFASARNEYLKEASGQWILSLDADEILGRCTREDVVARLEREPGTAYRFTIRNYFLLRDYERSLAPGDLAGRSVPGVGITQSQTIRLFPRRPGIAYSYRIHESLAPSLKRLACRVRDIDLPIHHFGYLFNRDGVRDKFARYLALGYEKLRDNPESPLAYLELGKLVLCGGDAAEARDLFDQCVRLAPTLPNAVYYAALARFKLGHYDECRRMASDGLRARRDDLNLRYLLAMTDKRQERFADAATTLHQLAARRPEHFATHLHLAECCLRSGRLQQAQPALARCRELAPWQAAIYVLEAELAELQCQPWRIPAILDDGVAAAGPCRELLDYRKVFDALGQASG